ncbi:hypothetical protein [Mesorhizobium sp. B2-7-2]|uniref:hypothetical protein n=1 Tax=Mesorhizobium sp. B2-7-2 TaxID=2589908 RepID=UPI00112D3963|nr:hypothetical protein [Mesorhizobium sp. B2-7-2]TPJ30259.1 hypothetical protein FJ425_05985 [Mesorhizobium sp. B2-7-2]
MLLDLPDREANYSRPEDIFLKTLRKESAGVTVEAEVGIKAGRFRSRRMGQRHSVIAQSWRRNWQHAVPFFAYPASLKPCAAPH